MKPYAIARYLTDAQKRRALSSRYRITRDRELRTAGHYCPLGRAIQGLEPCPIPDDVADAIEPGDGPRWVEIWDAAQAFIIAVDNAEIMPDELAAALGLTEAAS